MIQSNFILFQLSEDVPKQKLDTSGIERTGLYLQIFKLFNCLLVVSVALHPDLSLPVFGTAVKRVFSEFELALVLSPVFILISNIFKHGLFLCNFLDFLGHS